LPHVLALDQGTTSSRAIVFDGAGAVVATAQEEFAQHFPRDGWVEHEPADLWETQRRTAASAIDQAGELPAAIGITNQRETTLLWDRQTGEPVHRAIVWQDRRTAGLCDELRDAGHEDAFRAKTGLLLDPYFSGTKLAWLLEHVESTRERAEAGELAFGTVDTWLIWQLTGGKVHATDVTNASRTLLFDIHKGDWDDGLLGLLGVPRDVLPEVVASSGGVGETACDGLPAGIPIAGVAGDQQAALFGQACFEPGYVKCTYGTGCFVLLNTGGRPATSEHRLLTTPAWRVGDETTYALEGGVFVGGAVVQWLRDGLRLIDSAPEIEAVAASVPDTGGVVMVPAFTGLGAPHWDPHARGTVLGITRGTTRAHFARAALESIAHQVADVVEAMDDDTGVPIKELRVDGGAAANDLLMQMQADLLGVPVVRPAVTETTALGAAYLAGLAAGVWASGVDLAEQWREDRRFSPAVSGEQAAAARRRWKRAVARTRSGSPDADRL